MKPIQPITIWKNGESQEANLLNAYIINDNLESSCSFYYSLNAIIINDNLATSCSFYYSLCASGEGTEAMPLVIGQTLAEGNITMYGDTYLGWDGDNDFAFSYIAEKLNLTLIETT